MSNRGISITGSTVNATQIVVGDHATATSTQQVSQRDLLDGIERLLAQLQTSALDPTQRAQVAGIGEMVKAEAQSDRPRRATLETGLSLIEKSASSVSGIMAAVKAVRQVVGLFFGV